MNKKNLWTKVLFTVAMLFVTCAFAIPKDPCDVKEVCCEEPAPGPYAFSYPKDVGLSCPRDFYLHGEFLWMVPSEEGLDYAIEQDGAIDTFPLELGSIKGFATDSKEWDWRPGFRVGFGFYTNHDSWNFDLNWTYFRIKADAQHDNGSHGYLLPLLLPPQTPAEFTTLPNASARWSGDYNTVDLMVGKPYHVSRCYVSNPLFGIRAAWIDQDYHARYFMDGFKRNVYLENQFWGVGLRGAYEGDFLLGSGWFIYGRAAFALLFGKFDIDQYSDTTIDHYQYKVLNNYYTVKPNAELGMGISWSKFFHKNQYKVGLKVGYEFHQWWGQNQMRRFYDENPVANDITSRGDLSFNGFMFGLSCDF